jgi:hypothetical protein
MAEYRFTRSRTGIPVIPVGGGAYTNTFSARTIVRKANPQTEIERATGAQYRLLEALFIKQSGHLYCSHEQAIVPIKPGDVIVSMSGSLPADDNNPDAEITAEMITTIDHESNTAITEPYPLKFEDLPVLVIRGAEKYHNRDGKFFCDERKREDTGDLIDTTGGS